MVSKKNILSFFGFILLFYLFIGILLYSFQKSMIYFPCDQDFDDCEGFNDYERIYYEGTRLYYMEGSREGIVVYYHGNAGSACDRAVYKSTFERTNRSIAYVEYAGYSNDTRSPSKELILNDVENVNSFIEENHKGDVFVYGQSLGSGPASYHASLGGVDYLIFVNGFSDMADVASSRFPIYPAFLLKENYRNVEWLQDFEGEAIFFHGDLDNVIPYELSKMLYEKMSAEKKEYFLIEGRGHNDIWQSSEFREKIFQFIKSR